MKRFRKKLLSLVLAAAMFAACAPFEGIAALAEEGHYDVYVGDVHVIASPKGPWRAEGELPEGVTAGDGGLVLRDAALTDRISSVGGPLVVTLEGENTTGPLSGDGGLRLGGGGSLTIRSEYDCIWAEGYTDIRNVTLDLCSDGAKEAHAINLGHGGLTMSDVKGRLVREGGPGMALRVVYDAVKLERCDLSMQVGDYRLPCFQVNYDDQPSTDLSLTMTDCRVEARTESLWGICVNGEARISGCSVVASTKDEETGAPAFLANALTATDSKFVLDHGTHSGCALADGGCASLTNTTVDALGYVGVGALNMKDSQINIQYDQQSEFWPLWVTEPGVSGTIVNSGISVENPSGDGVGFSGPMLLEDSALTVRVPGVGISTLGDVVFSGCELDVQAGEIALKGDRYVNITLSGSRASLAGKCGILAQHGRIDIAGGDVTIDAGEAALLVDSYSENPDDALRIGSNTVSDEPIAVGCERQGGELFYSLGEDLHFDWLDWDESLKYMQFDRTAENAVKRVRLYGNGAFTGSIDAPRRALSEGMIANFTATFSSGADRAALTLAIPEALELIPDSVTMNGEAVESNFEDGALSVTTDRADGALRFSAYVTGEGDCEVTGTAVTEKDGERKEAALTPCALTLTGFAMGLPRRTSRRTIGVSGSAVPGSAITFYDNGAKAGEAQASLAGAFSGELNLNGTGEKHSITAAVKSPDGKTMKTRPQELEYSIDCAEAGRLTITNTIHGADIDDLQESVCVVDFADPSASSPNYTFFPEYPTLSYELSFLNCNDPLGMGMVYLITTSHDGTETRVTMEYDPEREVWLGAQDYDEYTVPERFSVAYTGGNYGTVTLMGEEIPYRLETDGSVRLGDGDDALIMKADGNVQTFTDLEGNGFVLKFGGDGHMTLSTTDDVQLLDVDAFARRISLSDGKESVWIDRNSDSLTIIDPESAQSVLLSDDGERLEVDDGSGNPMRYLTREGLDTVEYPDGTAESWRTSEDGLSRVYTARDGSALSYRYDDRQRLVSVTGDGVSLTADYGEDGCTLTDEKGEVTRLEYNPDGSVSKISWPGALAVSYTYDGEGRVQTVTDPMGNTTRYDYDGDGKLLSVCDDDGVIAEYVYDERGAVVERRLGNGVQTRYAGDGEALSDSVVNVLPDGSTLSEQTTVFGEDGLATGQTGTAGSWSFGYDGGGQLVSVTGGDGDVTEYTYTKSGTLASKTVNGARTDYTSNALNQITAVGEDAYEYDVNGRLVRAVTGEGEAAYEWDAFGRLVRQTAPDGTVTEYGYDVFGNRSSVTVNGETTRYIWTPCEMPVIIGAILPDGSYVRYVQGAGLEARVGDDGPAYFVYDALGSVTALVGGDGQVLNRYAYDPEGRLLDSQESVENPFRYVGRFGVMTDDDGLCYMRARYFSEALGTFLSPDPAGQTLDMNLYRYAENNRVQKVDLTGLGGFWVIYYHWRKVTDRYFVPIQASIQAPSSDPRQWEDVVRDGNRQLAMRVRDSLQPSENAPRMPYIPWRAIQRVYDVEQGYARFLKVYDHIVNPLRWVMEKIGLDQVYGVYEIDKTRRELSVMVSTGKVSIGSLVSHLPHVPDLFIALAYWGMVQYNNLADNINRLFDAVDRGVGRLADIMTKGYINFSDDAIQQIRDTQDILTEDLADALQELDARRQAMAERLNEGAADHLQEATIGMERMAEDFIEAAADVLQEATLGLERIMEDYPDVAEWFGIDPEMTDEYIRRMDAFNEDINAALNEMGRDFENALDEAMQAVVDYVQAAAQPDEGATDAPAEDVAPLEPRLDEATERLRERLSDTVEEVRNALPQEAPQETPQEAPQETPQEAPQETPQVTPQIPAGGVRSGMADVKPGSKDGDPPRFEYFDDPPADYDEPTVRYEDDDPHPVLVDGEWGYWMIREHWELEPEMIWVEVPDPEPVSPDPVLPEPKYISPEVETPPSMDPSGYVYEAVPGNRVEGVTATVYYKPDLDTPDEEAVAWDAGAYDQVNPQQTDRNGEYGWMVPAGRYKVVWEKEGYGRAESEWLPVPPVQTEVNMGLVSDQPPILVEAVAYDAGFAEFTFDRYVTVDSVNDETAEVLRPDGTAVQGGVDCADAAWAEGVGLCGRRFRFIFWEGVEADEALTLRVDGATGYNGLPAEAVETQMPTVRLVGDIEAPETVEAAMGDDIEVAIRVTDAYGDPMAGESIRVETPSSGIAPAATTLTTGEDGTARLAVACEKAGAGVIRLSDAQGRTGVKVTVKVAARSSVPEGYAKAMAGGRAWLEDLKITWTDGKKEDEVIAGRYADAFAAESDVLRELLADGGETEALGQLDAWDERVRSILFDSINRYISAEDLNDISEILYERGRMAYRLSA